MRTCLISPIALLVIAAPVALRAQTATPSPVLVYQGHLSEGGSPVTGSRNFQFFLLNSTGAALWTSDLVPVAVTHGVYAVELGGAGMNPIPQSVLSTAKLALRIQVGSTVLSPDVPVLPALQAGAAAPVETSSAGVDGSQNTPEMVAQAGNQILSPNVPMALQPAASSVSVFSGDMGGAQNKTVLLRLQGYPWTCPATRRHPGSCSPIPGPSGWRERCSRPRVRKGRRGRRESPATREPRAPMDPRAPPAPPAPPAPTRW